MAPPVPESIEVVQSMDPESGRAFNSLTSTKYDKCSLQNQDLISSKPMKYYVNQFNSPQTNPFETYSVIGNQRVYDVRNEFERPLPTRLNPIYPIYTEPYSTTPFLASIAPDRSYIDTSSGLRWGSEMRPKNSETSLTERDYNRWSPGVNEYVVQNAGQFTGGVMQQPIGQDGYYNYTAQNNVIFGNSALPGGSTGWGISSRVLMHNFSEINKC